MSQSDSHGRIARGHVSVSAALHERLAAYCARTGVTMSSVLEHVTADLPNVDADRVPLPVSHRMRRHALFAARERRWSLDDTMERAINAALDAEGRPSAPSRAPMVSHAAVRR